MQGSTEAVIVKGTSLVEINSTARSARLAAAIANAIADAYIDWNIESRFKEIGQSSQFLTAQIEDTKSEIQAKEKDLMAYGRQKDIVSADANANPTLQRLDSVNRDLGSAITDRVSKESRYEEVRAQPPEALVDPATAAVIATMRNDLQRQERDYAEKLNVYKPEWPAMQQLKSQIDGARKNIETAIAESAAKAVGSARSDYQTALRREQSLRAMTRTQESEAIAQGSSTVEYRNLRTEIDTKRALLDTLMKQQGELEVLSRVHEDQFTSVRIVDRALEPGEPYKPSLKKNLLGGGALGLMLGVGAALFLSHLDRSLRSVEQVETGLRLPALGVIPAGPSAIAPSSLGRAFRVGRKKKDVPAVAARNAIDLLPHEDPRSTVAEAYRAFRTSLLLSRAGGVKSLVITSALPQEGKTTTAANLAVVLGQLGKRVLLVDADLHQPKVHEVFEVSGKPGLVSILAEGIEPSRAIVKTRVPGVFVVPAGPDSPNPSGLLASDAMHRFMELALSNFDYVIVDTPPVLPVSDTLVFAQQTDGVVLCVRGGRTSREEVARARDLMQRGGIPILGVLINGLESGPGYRQYEYGYGPTREVAKEEIAEKSASVATQTS